MLEPEELARWERLTAAMLRNAGADDPEAFAQVVSVVDQARRDLAVTADHLRHPMRHPYRLGGEGYSWSELAAALGITRQACQQRFGKVS